MKKYIFFIIFGGLIISQSYAQPLTGTKSIPGSYATIALAIADLNSKGVGTGGVTFNIAAGYTETFLTPTAGYITTQTGSATRPVIFQKSGTGANPVITAPTGVNDGTATDPPPVTLDAIIAIAGCDYVTFDGINLSEASANIEPASQMEWGYAILKASGVNGSQNITIKNCSVTLNKENPVTKGIYSNNHTTANLAQLSVTDSAGANSNLKIFGNSVTNSCFGIYLSGYNAPTAPFGFYDLNNEIGVEGANIITDFGGAPGEACGIFTKYQNVLKVANNTLTTTTVNFGTSIFSILFGINLSTAYNASFDLYGNTVTLHFEAEDPYNSYLYGIYSTMGANGTNNVANIYNNTVTNCTFPTPETNGDFDGIYLYNMGVTANVYGNTVSNNLYGSNSTASRGNIKYMWVQQLSTTLGPLNVYNNSITGNARRQSTMGPGSTDMLYVAGKGTVMKTYNNLIDQNDVRASGSTHCINIYYNDETSKDIYNNTVSNIINANGSVVGLQNGNGTLGRIYNNVIRKISASSNATGPYIIGINHGSGLNMYYYNNMISELSCPAAVGSLGYDWNKLTGIYIDADPAANSIGFYNNTVYLNATITSTEFGSSALTAASLYGVDMRNNILINTSASAGNGKTTGIFLRTTVWTGFSSNYNNIYTGTPGATRQIFRYGTQGTYSAATTLSDYKTLVTPQELQSVTENTPFVNVATSPYDVHVKTNVATQCEAGGFSVSSPLVITTDFDGDARFPNPGYPVGSSLPNAPDIGADEFGGMASDVTAPAIVYTPLLNTNSLTSRTLIATITDGTGVPSTPPGNTGLPVLYWKLNSGAWQPAQATYTGSNNAYSFTFGAANAVGDVISYYVVAQDLVSPANVGVYPWVGASGFTRNPPACSTPPSTPASYTIVNGIQGVFHVGVAKNYTTLKAAVTDLNSKSITGPVTFILDDNTYPSETYPITFNANAGSSATNTVTVKPNTGASPVFTGSMTGSGLIKFRGLDYVTIDGSNNGTSSQNLTFENTSLSAGAHVIGITNSASSDPSTKVTLKNCILIGQNSNMDENTYLIVFNENGGLNGGGYNDCVITGNTLKKSKFGISISATLGNRNHNIVISNNTIGSTDALSYISRYGIAFELSDNTLVSGNDIMGNADGATGQYMFPIFGIIYYNNSTNTKITGNKIHDWYGLGPGCYGIKCGNGDSPTVNEISNNLIYDLKCLGENPGTGSLITYGILVRDGGNMKIWHNTIYLSGPYLYGSDSYGPSSGCIGLWDWTTDQFDIRDNILRNSMTNPSPDANGSYGKAYGIMISASSEAAAAAKFSALDYNDYYIDGYHGMIAQWYGIGGTALVDIKSMEQWQAFTGKEEHMILDNPLFVSNLDLHPTNPDVNNVGGPQLLPVDFAGATRYNPTDMGAWEWSLPVSVINTLAATDVAQTTATLNGSINTNSEYCNIWFEYGTSTSYGSVATPVPSSVRSVGALLSSGIGIAGLNPNTIYHYRFAGDPATSNQANVYGEDMTFTTLPGAGNKTLNLTLFLEGLYNAGISAMNQSQGSSGAQFGAGIADQVTVELHDPASPYATAYSYGNADLSTAGAVTISTLPSGITGSYYIVIKHRNSIETWSSAPVSFTGAGPFSYNFSTSASQAYGNNLKQAGTVYVIWGADVNQDGIVDGADMSMIFNASQPPALTGYNPQDVNGDGIVDGADMSTIFNNSQPPAAQTYKP